MAKDDDLVMKNWEKDVARLLPRMNLTVVLAKLTPEQRLAGLTLAKTLQVLPVEALRGLSEDYVRTLSPELQAFVRARVAKRLLRGGACDSVPLDHSRGRTSP